MRKTILILLLVLAAPMLGCQAVCAEVAGDTLLAMFERNNLELRLAREQGVRAVLESKAQNGLDATEVEYSPFFTRGMSGMTSSELVVSQSFELPWAYTSRARMTRLQSAATDAAYAALRQDVLLRVRNLLIEVYGLRQTLAIVDRRLAIADSLQMLYQTRLERGDATALDVNMARIEHMAVAREHIEVKGALAKALAALTALNGGVALDDSAIVTDFILDGCSTETVRDLRLAAADAAVDAAVQRERVARAESMPRLTLGYRRNTDADMASHGVLVGASIPLFSNQKRRTIARHEREEAEIQRRQTELELVQERTQLETELQQAADILAVSDTSVVESSLVLLRRSLAAGALSLPDYLRQCAPLYEQLQTVVATRTLYRQTLSSLRRGDL